jgi:hypothetical protein
MSICSIPRKALGCLVLCVLGAGASAVGGQRNNLSLHIIVARTMPFEGPCPVVLHIQNLGSADVGFAPLENGSPFSVVFDEPKGWKHREYWEPMAEDYPNRAPVLRSGQSIQRTIYLHNVFSTLQTGRTVLRVTATLWKGVPGGPQAVHLVGETPVELELQGGEALGRRLASISEQINACAAGGRRLLLYESVRHLSHPKLIPLFLGALRDKSYYVARFHTAARYHLATLCEEHNLRQVLVDYMSERGGRGDQVIFEAWKQDGVRPAPQQIVQLRRARDPWVQLRALQYFGGSEADYDSLRNEITDLNHDYDELASLASMKPVSPAVPSGLPPDHPKSESALPFRPSEKRRSTATLPLLSVGLVGLALGLVVGLAIAKVTVRRRRKNGKSGDIH